MQLIVVKPGMKQGGDKVQSQVLGGKGAQKKQHELLLAGQLHFGSAKEATFFSLRPVLLAAASASATAVKAPAVHRAWV